MRIAQQVHLGKPWHVSPNGNFHEENYDRLWSPGISIWWYTNSTLWYTIKVDKPMSMIQIYLDPLIILCSLSLIMVNWCRFFGSWGKPWGAWGSSLINQGLFGVDIKPSLWCFLRAMPKSMRLRARSPVEKSLGIVCPKLQGWWKDWGNCPNIGQHFRCVKYDVEFTQLYLSGILKRIGTKDFTPRLVVFSMDLA
jgi:hypothetical protein